MKKLISKLSILLLVLFVGLSLTACKEDGGADTYSKEVAYGDLSSETYASLGTLSLSEKALYDELRTNAYDYLLDELIKKLVPTNEYSVEKNREELEKIVAKNCYGTNKEDELKEIPAATKATQEEKFADQMYLLGVNIKDSQGNIEIYSDNCLKYFINELAQKEYVRKMLTTSTSKYYYCSHINVKS